MIEYEIMLFCQVPSEDAYKHHSSMSLASLLGSSPAGHKNLLVCRLSAVWETLVLRLQLYTKLAIALCSIVLLTENLKCYILVYSRWQHQFTYCTKNGEVPGCG